MKLTVNRIKNRNNFNNVLWYGGDIISVECDDKSRFVLTARGIVSCKLISKKDINFIRTIDNVEIEEHYCKGDVIEIIKDKNEMGLFYTAMIPYIKDDIHLENILLGLDEDFELHFDNNNWLELTYYDSNGEIEYDEVIDEDNILNAVKIIMDELRAVDNFIRNEYSIYCRSANYSEDAIESQIITNLSKIQEHDPSITRDKVNIYIDNGFNGLELNNPAFLYLMDDLKQYDMGKIYTKTISRISRDFSNIFNIKDILDKHSKDIYLCMENNSLSKLISLNKSEKEIEYEK